MAFKINTIPLCKNETIGASGTAGTFISDKIDLRDIMQQGSCSFTFVKSNSAATCGSCVLSYQVSSVNGTYIDAGTFGTHGSVKGAAVSSFTPIVAPFMKIKCVTGTSAPLVLTGELNVL